MKKSTMITASPFKVLLLFAIPMILGNLFQQLYSIVDSVIVGQVVGQEAFTAVGSTTAICYVYIAVALGLATGCMIVFSQLLGAGRIGRMKTAIYTAMITLGALSIIALILGLATTDIVLDLTNIKDSVFFDDARTYYVIYAWGFPALFMYNIVSSVFNSLGKSQFTLYLLGGSSILNVILDLWFVKGLGMGVAGAAIATDISQYLIAAIGVVWVLIYLKKHYKCEETSSAFEFRLLGNMLKVAIPTMIAQVTVSVGYAILMSLVNTFDVNITSGYVAAYKIDSLCAIPMVQFGNAMATYTGQNVGAKKFERVNQGLKASMVLCAIAWVVFAGLIFIFGHDMIGWFMTDGVDEAAYAAGVSYMRVMCSLYICLGLMYVFAATLRGAGDAILSVIAVICNFATRCIFAYIAVAIWDGSHVIEAGLNHAANAELFIWWSNPIGWIVALVICALRFKTGIWKTKRLADKV